MAILRQYDPAFFAIVGNVLTYIGPNVSLASDNEWTGYQTFDTQPVFSAGIATNFIDSTDSVTDFLHILASALRVVIWKINGGAELMRLAAGGLSILKGSAADASAALDVVSTTKGAALPRMTTAQRDLISSPIEGLEVYNLTTHKKNFWDGGAWRVVTST